MPGAAVQSGNIFGVRDFAGEAVWCMPVHASRVTALVLSADGTQLWSGCDAADPKRAANAPSEAALKQIDCQDGKVLRSYESEYTLNVRLLALHKKGGSELRSELLVCDGDRGLTKWHVADGTCIGSRTALQPGGVTVSPSNLPAIKQGAAVVDMTKRAMPERDSSGEHSGMDSKCSQDLETEATTSATEGRVVGEPTSGAYSAAAAAASRGSFLQRLIGSPPSMHTAVLSQDGTVLYTGSRGALEQDITVWSVNTGRLLRTLSGHSGPVLCLCLSPDGASLYSGSYDKTIRVWSTRDGRLVRTVKAHRGGVRALAAAPGGGRLYSCGSDNTIQVWDTVRWLCLRALHGRHEDATWPTCMALSADGKLLASGSTGPFGGSTIKVFDTVGTHDTDAGKCLATFAQCGAQDKEDISSLLFSPDGQRLYSGASDGTVAAWKLTTVSQCVSQAGLRTGFL